VGDYRQALAEIRRAHELDPLSPIININVGLSLGITGDIAEARAQFKRTLEMDPSWFNAHYHLGLVEVMDGRMAESIPHLQKSVEINPTAVRPMGMLGYALAIVGRRAEAMELLKRLEDRYSQGIATASNIATIYIGLGEKEKAYEWLEKGFQDKDIEITRSRWQPQFNSIREESRFKELIERTRIPNAK
jgi:Flp pilus assembly protein TadD